MLNNYEDMALEMMEMFEGQPNMTFEILDKCSKVTVKDVCELILKEDLTLEAKLLNDNYKYLIPQIEEALGVNVS